MTVEPNGSFYYVVMFEIGAIGKPYLSNHGLLSTRRYMDRFIFAHRCAGRIHSGRHGGREIRPEESRAAARHPIHRELGVDGDGQKCTHTLCGQIFDR